MTPRREFPPPPTASRALVLRAHPFTDSFSTALAEHWADGARASGAEVEAVDLHGLDFEPRLRAAHRHDQPLEPDLVRVRDAIADSAHLVIATPVWWGSTPAVLKGFIDRVFLPGWAYRVERGRPVGGLAGRSGRLLLTMDAPGWWDRLVYRQSARRHLREATLRFCGVKPVAISTFTHIEGRSPAQREAMLRRAHAAGAADGRLLAG